MCLLAKPQMSWQPTVVLNHCISTYKLLGVIIRFSQKSLSFNIRGVTYVRKMFDVQYKWYIWLALSLVIWEEKQIDKYLV